MQREDPGQLKLWAELHTVDLTAEMAEVIGTALLAGAKILRDAGAAAPETVTLRGYATRLGWERFGPMRPVRPRGRPAEIATATGPRSGVDRGPVAL